MQIDEQQQRRSSELTQLVSDMYNKDIEFIDEKPQQQQKQQQMDQQMYLSLSKKIYKLDKNYMKQQTQHCSQLSDLRKKYLKNREDQYRRSVSHHHHHDHHNRSPLQNNNILLPNKKCFSPKQQKRQSKIVKQIVQPAPKNNLRNILKTNYQQQACTFEENPQNEIIRKEVSQLIDIPQHLQLLELYSFQKTLGCGATAEVKMARHKELDINVAIKIYDKKKMNQQALKNLSREVDILLALRHPNIIRLYHMVENEKSIYLIMEYSSPTSLDCFMKGRPFKRVNEEEAKIIFRQIIDAMKEMHSQNIAHRDMKLENILIDYQTRKVKIIDFGYSVRIEPNQKQLISCGTPSYMAPEIVKKSPYDLSVDVWACGVILFKLLTGVFPFRGNSEKDLNKKILTGKIEYPSFVNCGAKNLINLMLRLDPRDRISIQDVSTHQWIQ